MNSMKIEKSKPGNTIEFGSLKLVNNVWGAPAEESFTSSIFQNDDGSIGWSWDRLNPILKPGQVYPQPLYPGLRIGGSPQELSNSPIFPIRWREVHSLVLEVDYVYSRSPSGVYNLAYDIFFINSNKPGPDAQRRAEIMIWLEGNQKQPASSYQGDYSDGQNSYALYSRMLIDGRLYAAFIMKVAAQKHHSVDARKLIDKLQLDPDWYIPGVDFGNEIWQSSGKIEIIKIKINLNGKEI
jgi:hypothetical protein